ncbi:MAG: lamin tail domain-containing protein [bacterium]|nr:lamin tail domain-containing protein [bacterium]
MKFFIIVLAAIFLFLPFGVFALCSSDGYTIVYINGIRTKSIDDANTDLNELQRKFIKYSYLNGVVFHTGYNPSHLAGAGDLIESASQLFDSSVSDYDFKNILLQIYPEVTTRKILLVGHSQGTFYANKIHDYLLANGEEKGAVGIYNVATPDSSVAGYENVPSQGAYLTSQNDKVINAVRAVALKVGAKQPLPANIDIALTPQEAADPNGGHSFSGVYLSNAPVRMVSEMEDALNKLNVSEAQDIQDGVGCFIPPPKNFSYRVQQGLFAVADPMASGAVSAYNAEQAMGTALGNALAGAAKEIKNTAMVLLAFRQNAPQAPQTVLPTSLSQVISTPAPKTSQKANTNETQILASAESITDNVGGASDTVFENNVPALTPDPEIANNPSPSGGGSSGGFLGSISAPGAGAAPDPVNSSVSIQETSTSTPPSPPPPPPADTAAPDIAFSISECDSSLSSDICFLTNPALHLSWSSSASDTDHFEIVCEVNSSPCAGLSFAPTSATSTEYSVPTEKQTYIFKAKAVDVTGNASVEVIQTVSFAATPVVINEVAWMGTGSSATTNKDEWIELYNSTDYSVNLSGFSILFLAPGTTTPAQTILLTNTIPSKGFYLIERTNDTAVSDVAADLVFSFGASGLLNSGMILRLERGGAIIDRTPDLCSSAWCAGSSSTYQTMERIGPLASGDGASNWGTALSEFILNGKNADGQNIKGTPKKRNSKNYLISQTGTIVQNKTLTKADSPYIILQSGLTVQSGVTLTIDPGVVMKFVVPNEPALTVNGAIKSNGTAAEPVVFTTFADDIYGGDMNADGVCDLGNASSTASCPAVGSWKQIFISALSVGSEFHNTIVRYGGKWFSNMTFRGMVDVDSTPVVFDAATFEYAEQYGLQLSASDSQIQNSVFRNNNKYSDSIGLYAVGGSPVISQNTFQQNRTGLQLVGSLATVGGNTFTDNSSYAVYSSGLAGMFTQNSGSGNGKNGILLFGQIVAVGATTTLEANSIPYIISSSDVTLPGGAGLVVNPGTEFRGDYDAALNVNGTMTLGGVNKSDIIFTSLSDSASIWGGWKGILVNAGGFVSGGGFTLRYGGGSPSVCLSSCAGFRINGGRVELTNALIEKNYTAGMRIINSASTTLSNFEFNQHRTPSGQSTGLILSGSSMALDSASFSDNDFGISSSASSISLMNAPIFINNGVNTSPANLFP